MTAGTNPSLVSLRAKVVSVAATTISQAASRPSPPPGRPVPGNDRTRTFIDCVEHACQLVSIFRCLGFGDG